MMEDFKFLGNRPQPILLHKLASALRKWIPVICQRLESSLGKRLEENNFSKNNNNLPDSGGSSIWETV